MAWPWIVRSCDFTELRPPLTERLLTDFLSELDVVQNFGLLLPPQAVASNAATARMTIRTRRVMPHQLGESGVNMHHPGGVRSGHPGPRHRPKRQLSTEAKSMAKDFEGKIELDIRDSTPDWSPFGGRIEMPTMDRLAGNGLTYSQWPTTALRRP